LGACQLAVLNSKKPIATRPSLQQPLPNANFVGLQGLPPVAASTNKTIAFVCAWAFVQSLAHQAALSSIDIPKILLNLIS
jgi:hypothetical protein